MRVATKRGSTVLATVFTPTFAPIFLGRLYLYYYYYLKFIKCQYPIYPSKVLYMRQSEAVYPVYILHAKAPWSTDKQNSCHLNRQVLMSCIYSSVDPGRY